LLKKGVYFMSHLPELKKQAFLMVENNNKSTFIREIEEDWNLCKAKDEGYTQHCSQCVKGELVLKRGPYSELYVCSNFPLCKYTQKKNSEKGRKI
jgi:ssDNA-binding Zn-finger/Zn-ribbon topoisomerase 1